MDNSIELESSSSIISIDEHFKLYAGPGAGKTTFLVNHVRNILANSKKLMKTKRVACITYTNTAVLTLKNRLEHSLESVAISTIHSFCYTYVVKPFLWLIKDVDFPISKLDGHDEIKLTRGQLNEFIIQSNQKYITDTILLQRVLNKLRWVFINGELNLSFTKLYENKVGKYSLKKESYYMYKELYWKEGKLSHDDVLYFAYRILLENPRVLEIIRAKFPYILIDEFQDTTPIQTEIIRMISDKETVIGVIGDKCQSIYSFQGANVELFNNFKLSGIKEYIIKGNRRSTEEIINVLNNIRSKVDFTQFSVGGKRGNKPAILVGDNIRIRQYLLEHFPSIVFLNYKNIESTEIELFSFDSNSTRAWLIYYIVQSIEVAKNLEIKQAIKYMLSAYRKVDSFSKKNALENIHRLVKVYNDYYDKSLSDFYNSYLVGFYNVGSKITTGKVKAEYDNVKYHEFIRSLKNINNNETRFRTIHDVKGDEFQSVCVEIPQNKKSDGLDIILSPNMNDESHRVYYVAFSRAKEHLFISVPLLNEQQEVKLSEYGFSIMKF